MPYNPYPVFSCSKMILDNNNYFHQSTSMWLTCTDIAKIQRFRTVLIWLLFDNAKHYYFFFNLLKKSATSEENDNHYSNTTCYIKWFLERPIS